MIAALNSTDVWMLLIVFVLLIILIFLSVAEMGLSRMTKPKAAAMADKGLKSGKALIKLVGEPQRWVNPLLLTVNICQTVQATLTGIVAGRAFGAAGVVVGVLLNVVVFFVLAEAVPKTYAVLHSERAAMFTARPVLALVSFPPLQLISRGLIGLTNVIVRGKGLQQGPFVSEQELLGIVEAAADDEVIEHEERELIESIIEFGDTVAREVMVPRPDIVTVEHLSTVSTALDVAIEHGFSRLPVLGPGEDDDIIGLAYTKDLMRTEREGGGGRAVTELIRPVRFVPENKAVNRLMREMQAEKFHLAIVADEYDNEETEVQRLADGDYLVDGGMSIGDLDDLLDLTLPDDEWDTVGGFLFGTLEHVPEEGESIEHDGWRFTAAEMEGRRVRRVRVAVIHEHDGHDDEGDRNDDE